MRKSLLLILSLSMAIVNLTVAYPAGQCLYAVESPWASRKLYYVNGSLWWRHILKRYLVQYGTLELWYPVYANVSGTVTIYIRYHCEKYAEKEIASTKSLEYVWLVYHNHNYRNRVLENEVRRIAVRLPSLPGDHKTVLRIKVNETGILVLAVLIGPEYRKSTYAHSAYLVFATVVGFAPDLNFGLQNYTVILSSLRKYSELLNGREKTLAELSRLIKLNHTLSNEIKMLIEKVKSLNSTLIELKKNASIIEEIYLNKSREVYELEKHVEKLSQENTVLSSEVAKAKWIAVLLFTFSPAIVAFSLLYRRKLFIAMYIFLLIAPIALYSAPQSTVTEAIYVKGVEIEITYPQTIRFPLKIVVKYPYPIKKWYNKGVHKLFRIDKTGTVLLARKGFTEFNVEYENWDEYTDTVVSVFSPAKLAGIPLSRDCGYLALIATDRGFTVIHEYSGAVRKYSGELVFYFLYGYEGNFFDAFKSVFSEELDFVKYIESETSILRSSLNKVNSSVQKAIIYKQQLSNLAKSLEKEVIDVKARINEYSVLLSNLNVHRSRLLKQISLFIEENNKLKAEKSFWETIIRLLIIVLFISATISIVAVYKAKKTLAIVVLLILLGILMLKPVVAADVVWVDEDRDPKRGYKVLSREITLSPQQYWKGESITISISVVASACLYPPRNKSFSRVVDVYGFSLIDVRAWLEDIEGEPDDFTLWFNSSLGRTAGVCELLLGKSTREWSDTTYAFKCIKGDGLWDKYTVECTSTSSGCECTPVQSEQIWYRTNERSLRFYYEISKNIADTTTAYYCGHANISITACIEVFSTSYYKGRFHVAALAWVRIWAEAEGGGSNYKHIYYIDIYTEDIYGLRKPDGFYEVKHGFCVKCLKCPTPGKDLLVPCEIKWPTGGSGYDKLSFEAPNRVKVDFYGWYRFCYWNWSGCIGPSDESGSWWHGTWRKLLICTSVPSEKPTTSYVTVVFSALTEILVNSTPVTGVPVYYELWLKGGSVGGGWILGKVGVNNTFFTIQSLQPAYEARIVLEAPQVYGNSIFQYWIVNGTIIENNPLVYEFEPATTLNITAVYSGGTTPPGRGTTTIPLNGSIYYLPYQWIELKGNFSPGFYRIKVSSVFGAPIELIMAVLASPNGSVIYVPANGLKFNLTKYCHALYLTEKICEEYARPKYIMSCINYSDYYLVGLGILNPYNLSHIELLRPWLLDNGTTLAVYNITIIYTNKSNRIVYWKLIAVTSLNVSIDPVYDVHGVYLVWNVSFSYFAPKWMNISIEKPYQMLECKLLLGNYTVWKQRLKVTPVNLNLPESSKYSYAAVYVPYSELIERFLFNVVNLTARADFKNIIVPFEKESSVVFKPCGIKLDKFMKINSTHYYIRVRALAIPGNKEGEILSGGKIKVEYYGKILCDCEIHRVDEDLDVFCFIIKDFELGKGYLKIYYLPKSVKNKVWIVYPFSG